MVNFLLAAMPEIQPRKLRLILGDQLNINHSWFRIADDSILYTMMEVRQETDYVKHHFQKILAFFTGMREFAKELQDRSHRVSYLRLDDRENAQSIPENLTRLIRLKQICSFEYQAPDEYRLDQQLKHFCQSLAIPYTMVDSEHFLSDRFDLMTFFAGKQKYLMESFYRMMRGRYHILINDGKPVGGKWNYDIENRKRYDGEIEVPDPIRFSNEVAELKTLIAQSSVPNFGQLNDRYLLWPLNRRQALTALQFFIDRCLAHFGRYQDAMNQAHWSLFHSRLSFALNTKMLHPMEVIRATLHAWEMNPDRIGIAQVEGFIRQILGWREYMRGVYWAKMPEYKKLNFFGHHRPLPHYYWDGETSMNCMRCAIGQSLKYAYAHHIQRLMVTGNFALLAGIHPDEVDAWYLGVYIDAIEWVEITNTRGMSQFADGGLVATKPYISSANYIQKMSDYCQDCLYDPNLRYGDRSCPFNSLYWAFYHCNRHLLEKNARIGIIFRVWDRFSTPERLKILEQAQLFLDKIESL